MNIIVAILLLGFIIIIHELGHFLLAKKNGITVTEFSVGMGPRIASFVRKGTRYSLKLLPLGGSCMMLGEDETVDDEGAFHKKSVWARFSVIFAGAFFNFILAFVLALIVTGATGVDYPDIIGTQAGSPAQAAGLQEGDRILKINGKKIHFSREFDMYFLFHPISEKEIKITYHRPGEGTFTTSLIPTRKSDYRLGIRYGMTETAQIQVIDEGFPIGEQGVVVGDVILKVDGTEITSGQDLSDYFDQHPLTGQPVTVTILHEGTTRDISVAPKLVEYYVTGLDISFKGVKVSPLEVIKNSFYELKFYVNYAIESIGYLVSGKASLKEISGPVGIVNMVGEVVEEASSQGLSAIFLSLAGFCILISTNLGVMNLLPLPALDGGRLVFLLIEAVRRKPVPKEKEAMVHFVGMVLLMLLMVFVFYNDIMNIFAG
jgi:regulator of sigma E protease